MNLYEVEINETGEVLCVAARNYNHAADVMVTFFIARTASAPGMFSIIRSPGKAYKGSIIFQNVAKGETAGVIVRQPDGSMLFEPVIG